jgi:hypothetical protein
MLGNLTGEDRVPERHEIRAELRPCFGNDGRRGDGSGVGERIEDRVQAKEVIGMAVGDVGRREILSGRPDPVDDTARVVGSDDGVDQYRVILATDQRDRGCRPGRLPLTHRGYQPDDRFVWDDEYVEVQWTGHNSSFFSSRSACGRGRTSIVSKAQLLLDENDGDSTRHGFAVDNQYLVNPAADANRLRGLAHPPAESRIHRSS